MGRGAFGCGGRGRVGRASLHHTAAPRRTARPPLGASHDERAGDANQFKTRHYPSVWEPALVTPVQCVQEAVQEGVQEAVQEGVQEAVQEAVQEGEDGATATTHFLYFPIAGKGVVVSPSSLSPHHYHHHQHRSAPPIRKESSCQDLPGPTRTYQDLPGPARTYHEPRMPCTYSHVKPV